MKLLTLIVAISLASCVAVESESPDLQVLAGEQADLRFPERSADQGAFAWRLLEARGSAAILAGRFAEAHAAFSAVPVMELEPDLYPLAGRAALLVGEPQVARRLFHACLEARPNDSVARLDLARTLLLLDLPAMCLSHLELLPDGQQMRPATCELRGLALLATGEPREALRDFRRALRGGGDAARLGLLVERAMEQLGARRPLGPAPASEAEDDAADYDFDYDVGSESDNATGSGDEAGSDDDAESSEAP